MFTFTIGQKSCDVVEEMCNLSISGPQRHLNCALSDFSTSDKNRKTESTITELEADHRKNRAKVGKLSQLYHNRMNADLLLEGFRKTLESQHFPTNITVVSDFGNNGNISSILHHELKDAFPDIALLSVLIQPIEGLQGAPAVKCLIELQTSLEVSDGIIIRDYNDAGILLELEHCEISYVNLNKVIAADLAALFLQPNISVLHLPTGVTTWPWGVCSARTKLFDIRSSLWRANNRQMKSSSLTSKSPAPKYNALRAAANNIHALHQSFISVRDDENSRDEGVNKLIRSASVVDLGFDKRLRGLTASPTQSSSSEIATLLKWAAPGMMWPEDLGAGSTTLSNKSSIDRISRPLMRSGATGTANSIALSATFSSSNTRHYSDNETSQITASKLAGKNGSTASDSKAGPADMPMITALAFESPYAREYLHRSLSKAKALIEVNAYEHL
jgi:hypothetical protein